MAESPITARAQDFAAWYQDVVLQGDMAEPAEIVKGCMVIKPNGYAVWEVLQRELDQRFKASNHQNVYFPLLIPQSFLRKEAEHRSEEHTSELQSLRHLVCRLLLEKKKTQHITPSSVPPYTPRYTSVALAVLA